MKIFLSSCVELNSESIYCRELARLARLSKTEVVTLVSAPEEADLILIVDVFETDLYRSMRQNQVWQQWPEKSFVYCEGDYPPQFLHGLQSSGRKSLSGSGRFSGCAYLVHQACYPNACPQFSEQVVGTKSLLFSFAGRSSHSIRKELFSLAWPASDEVVIEDTSHYRHFNNEQVNRKEAHTRFWDLARRSKYVLCPRGTGTSSVRIFEMMEAGIAPVILSDDWLPPSGPNWEEFALFVPEKEIGRIYAKVKAHESEYAQRGAAARRAWERFFSPENYWGFLLASIQEIQARQKKTESFYAKRLPLLVFSEWCSQKVKATILLKHGIQNRISKLVCARSA